MRMSTSAHLPHLFLLLLLLTLFNPLTATLTFISPTQQITAGRTLVSPAYDYELGFFSPAGNANNYWYIGVWCMKIDPPAYVWVANRDTPLNNSNGVLTVRNGNLVLVDDAGKFIWSSNVSVSGTGVVVAELLDYGNFILRYENDVRPENYLWQSFDYPTDTLLPGMRLGWDAKTGKNRYITSWKSVSDPSTGDYSFKLNINGDPEIYLTQRNRTIYRSGPWNGVSFSGVPEMEPKSPLFTFQFVISKDAVYYSFNLTDNNVYSRLVVTSTGSLQRYVWITTIKSWNLYWYAPKDQCDDYRECGVYGICDTNASPICKCLKGFEPRNPSAWNLRDGSGGCVRVKELDCGTDGFLEMSHVKLPESGAAFMDSKMDLNACRDMCRKNCSCTGFSNVNVTGGGTGCVVWATDLYDMRQYAVAEGGQSFYLRVRAADLEQAGGQGSLLHDSGSAGKSVKIASITGGVAVLLCALLVFCIWKRRKARIAQGNDVLDEIRARRAKSRDQSKASSTIRGSTTLSVRDHSVDSDGDELDLPLFNFSTIVKATDKFSVANKLGQGGFGCVYKGVLEEGQVVAVKRLSTNSGQGIEEFKNEVKLIARLQHRNLVRLLGCCIDTEEKMLIYEYMENKSLDSLLFKKDNNSSLDWQSRFNIICGIARGLLYLHQDSRFRIIHRDMKASNVLLDKGMNPKISDFGMARIFGGDQTEGETKRVVGTYGYMAPEYAMDGLFSVKSDVFSFGVLVLEIVSGMKNRGFYQTNNQLNLLAYAWKLYREGRALEVVDSACGESYSTSEVMRSIQVGLLCVQESAEDRPNMSNVVLMLSSECSSMPQPKQPGYCVGRRPIDADAMSPDDESCTLNQVTVTVIDGR